MAENLLDRERMSNAGLVRIPNNAGKAMDMFYSLANKVKEAPATSRLWKLKEWLGNEIESRFPGVLGQGAPSNVSSDVSWVDKKPAGDVYSNSEMMSRLDDYDLKDWSNLSDIFEHQAGNRDAAGRLYTRNQKMIDDLFRTMKYKYYNRNENTMGDNYMTFVNSLDRYDPKLSSLKTWLNHILEYRNIDAARKIFGTNVGTDVGRSNVEIPESIYLQNDKSNITIDDLSPDYKYESEVYDQDVSKIANYMQDHFDKQGVGDIFDALNFEARNLDAKAGIMQNAAKRANLSRQTLYNRMNSALDRLPPKEKERIIRFLHSKR